MGLFKRSKKEEADDPQGDLVNGPDNEPESDDELGGLHTVEPRCRHYMFAHVALRQVAYQYPVEVIAALGSEKANALLDDLWKSVEEACKDEDRNNADQPAVDPNDVQVHRLRIGEYPAAVVQMPEPLGTTEAHFAAIVLCVNPEAKGLSKEDIAVRYFTLEKGATYEDEEGDRTALCEWTDDGTHLNHGDGPPVELSMFVDAIRTQL